MQIAPAAWAVAASAVIFGLGILVFSRGWLGGGDVKLITSTTLLIGGYDTPAFLFLMSIIGSALALVVLIHIKFGRHLAAGRPEAMVPGSDGAVIAAADRFRVPYGFAVALAACVVLFVQILHIQRA